MATKEYMATYNKHYNTNFPLKRMWHDVKGRARAKGMEFDFTYEEFVALAEASVYCPVFGCLLQYKPYNGTKEKNPCRASLDRKDSSKGYTKDNTWFISWKANEMKNQHTTAELKILVEALEREGIA